MISAALSETTPRGLPKIALNYCVSTQQMRMKYVVNQFMLKLVSSTEIRRRLKKNKEIIPGVKIALLNYLDLRSK